MMITGLCTRCIILLLNLATRVKGRLDNHIKGTSGRSVHPDLPDITIDGGIMR